MNSELISQEDLLKLTGYQMPSYLIKWLDDARIPYKRVGSTGRIFTTRSAINHSLYGKDTSSDDWEIDL